jgi:hypothetical protein
MRAGRRRQGYRFTVGDDVGGDAAGAGDLPETPKASRSTERSLGGFTLQDVLAGSVLVD